MSIRMAPYAHLPRVLPEPPYEIDPNEFCPALKAYNDAYAEVSEFIEQYKVLSNLALKQEAAYAEMLVAIEARKDEEYEEESYPEYRQEVDLWDMRGVHMHRSMFASFEEEWAAFEEAVAETKEAMREKYEKSSKESSEDMIKRAATLPHEYHKRLCDAFETMCHVNDHLKTKRFVADSEIQMREDFKKRAEIQAEMFKRQADEREKLRALCQGAQLVMSTAALNLGATQTQKQEEREVDMMD